MNTCSYLDDQIEIWELDLQNYDNKKLMEFKGHDGSILRLVITPNGRSLISASSDSTVKVWDLTKFMKNASHNGSIKNLVITPDDKHLIPGITKYLANQPCEVGASIIIPIRSVFDLILNFHSLNLFLPILLLYSAVLTKNQETLIE